MSTNLSIVARLAALENAVVELQQRLSNGAAPVNWVERFTGSFKDEPAFAKVIEYGRALRMADQPPENLEP